MPFLSINFTGFTINNFRVFGSETSFKLSPITILTGMNSSGKSSFTKALHLLAKSYKANGLRYLELMESDLKIGGFEEIKNSLKENKEISFAIDIETNNILSFSTKKERYKFEFIYISKGLQSIKVFKEAILVLECVGSLEQPPPLLKKNFIKLPFEIINTKSLREKFKNISEEDFVMICESILSYLQTDTEAHTNKEEYYNADIELNSYDIVEESYKRIMDGLRVFGEEELRRGTYFDEDKLEEIHYNDKIIYSANPRLKEILPLSFLKNTDDSILELFLRQFLNLEVLDKLEPFPLTILKNLFGRFEFIDGIRATQEIVYTKDNSPGFYKTLADIYSHQTTSFYNLKKWIVDEFKLIQLDVGQKIEDVIQIEQIVGLGYLLKIKKNGKNIGLTGLGYGVAQLLPIFMRVSLHPNAIFIIEEPESNLHPSLQSKLADFFASALKTPHTISAPLFIIETHSEYLIRKLQYLTAKGIIKEEESQLYYFNHPDIIPTGEDQIKKININKDGSLTDNFGKGFYDEATSWKFELLKLNNPQKN